MFKKILCASDGSENSFKALAVGVELAQKFDAQLHVILVEDSLAIAGGAIEVVKEEKRREDRLLKKYIKRITATAETSGIRPNMHVFSGHPVRRIVAFAQDNHFDLLVIGATGHSEFYETLLGSRADRIVDLARCPVLVIR